MVERLTSFRRSTVLIGYARVSTDQQDHALQLDALRQAGCERVFIETASGSRADRAELARALEQMRQGDTPVVWRLDRLARSLRHLIDIAETLRQREIDDLRVLISVEVNVISVLDEHRDAIDISVQSERAIASRHYAFPAHAFAARMRIQRELLSRQRDDSDGRLTTLRAQAIETYGSLSAIAAAADRHRAEALRTASIAEQGQIDDFSAARFTRASQAARRSRADAA